MLKTFDQTRMHLLIVHGTERNAENRFPLENFASLMCADSEKFSRPKRV